MSLDCLPPDCCPWSVCPQTVVPGLFAPRLLSLNCLPPGCCPWTACPQTVVPGLFATRMFASRLFIPILPRDCCPNTVCPHTDTKLLPMDCSPTDCGRLCQNAVPADKVCTECHSATSHLHPLCCWCVQQSEGSQKSSKVLVNTLSWRRFSVMSLDSLAYAGAAPPAKRRKLHTQVDFQGKTLGNSKIACMGVCVCVCVCCLLYTSPSPRD